MKKCERNSVNVDVQANLFRFFTSHRIKKYMYITEIYMKKKIQIINK